MSIVIEVGIKMELATFIGLLILAGGTLISFITVFVKVGGRFSVIEEKVLNLEKNRDRTDIKLDSIQHSLNELLVRVAILDENIKNKNIKS
jgi:hypothetical protein